MDERWHETELRVRYKDTDRMGVVYYGNYLTFFEVGRTEMMRDLGLPYSSLEADGYGLVVTEAHARYHGNVDYDSIIVIRTAIGEMTKVRMRFDYEIVREDRGMLVSGYTRHACLNSRQRPTRLPSTLVELMTEKGLI